MATDATTAPARDLKQVAKDIVDSIEREREREIITRRFGLYDRRETLEQIGELLGITRERVRQLEKAILIKLQAHTSKLPHLIEAQTTIIETLQPMGGVGRVRTIATQLVPEADERDFAHLAFVATLAPDLDIVEENDHYHHGVVAAQIGEKAAKQHADDLVATIKKHGHPTTIRDITKKTEHDNEAYVASIASLSKHLANLKDHWGLVKWPTVNPKNIRDKIYVILSETKQPMHFSEIAAAIKKSDFKRKDVTVQAIHNELIKDKRFILIGRGIYALEEWGYKKGTVADIIAEILKDSGDALHRDEIIKRVLDKRQVKETTILLNLQGKAQFKRVAKATYTLAE